MTVETPDAPLIAPGYPQLLNFQRPANGFEGISINLHNNVWGTNFPAWYDEEGQFRFRLEFERGERHVAQTLDPAAKTSFSLKPEPLPQSSKMRTPASAENVADDPFR